MRYSPPPAAPSSALDMPGGASSNGASRASWLRRLQLPLAAAHLHLCLCLHHLYLYLCLHHLYLRLYLRQQERLEGGATGYMEDDGRRGHGVRRRAS